MALINNGQVIGTGSTDLILNTRGKVYVRVADRFYELNFKGGSTPGTTVVNNNTTTVTSEPDLSPYVTKKYLKAALGDYVTKRSWEDVIETRNALENAQLEGFTESISPITVNTMQLIAGTSNLQFDFIESLLDGSLNPANLYINDYGQLVCPQGVIKHYTLNGPEAVQPEIDIRYYRRWTIGTEDPTYLSLDESDKAYYVYLKVAYDGDITDATVTNNLATDPKGQFTGSWVVSTESFEFDEEPGYRYLLYALVNSEGEEGRSISYLNGFTEILPGQITAYVFKTKEGDQYLDFLNKKFKIGDDNEYLKWENGELEIKGHLTVTGGELREELKRMQAEIHDEIQCWFSDDVPPDEPAQTDPFPTEDTPSKNWPANTWIDDEKSHLGDLYYNVSGGEGSGQVYRYIKNNDNYYWIPVNDNALAEALKLAYEAQKSADEANQMFIHWASDGIFTGSEIQELEMELVRIQENHKNVEDTWRKYHGPRDINEPILPPNWQSANPINPLYIIYNDYLTAYQNYLDRLNKNGGEVPPYGIIPQWNALSAEEKANGLAIPSNFETLLKAYYAQNTTIHNHFTDYITGEFSGLAYLKKALQGTTKIDGGLILSNMLALGNVGEDDITAGLNGITKLDGESINPKSIAFWAGGKNIDKEISANANNDQAARAVIRHDGSGYFSNGAIHWDETGAGWLGGTSDADATIAWDAQGNVRLGKNLKIGNLEQTTLENLLDIMDLFELDENDDIKVKNNRGFYTESFISALGKNNTPGGGGGGADVSLSVAANSATLTVGSVEAELALASTISGLNTAINAINNKIPTEASESNKLADKAYVDEKLRNINSLYIGTTQVQNVSQAQALTGITKINEAITFNDNDIYLSQALKIDATKKIYLGNEIYLEVVNGAIHTNAGFYSDSFISALGRNETGTGGGGGLVQWGVETTDAIELEVNTVSKNLLLASAGIKWDNAIAAINNTISTLATKQYVDQAVENIDNLYIGRTQVQYGPADQALSGITNINGIITFNTDDVSLSKTLKLSTSKKIDFGDGIYLEVVNGELHTNVGFYSDGFISAMGRDDTSTGGGTSFTAGRGLVLDANTQELYAKLGTGLEFNNSGQIQINSTWLTTQIGNSTGDFATKSYVTAQLSPINTSIFVLQGYFDNGSALKALDSDKLGGQSPDHYATAEALSNLQTLLDSMFERQEDGSIKVLGGLWTESYISAFGQDTEGHGGGGTAFTASDGLLLENGDLKVILAPNGGLDFDNTSNRRLKINDNWFSNQVNIQGLATQDYVNEQVSASATPNAVLFVEQNLNAQQKEQALVNLGAVGRQYFVNNVLRGEVFGNYSGTNANIASGEFSHAEGFGTQAIGSYSHAEGVFNIADADAIHQVGIGTSTSRKDAHNIKRNGKHYILNIGAFDGTNSTDPDVKDLATVINEDTTALQTFLEKFDEMFTAHYIDGVLDSIEAKAGFWTESYVSSMGQNQETGVGFTAGNGLKMDPDDGTLDVKLASGGGLEFNTQGEIQINQNYSSDKTYVHSQDSPEEVWAIEHNLGKTPSVTIIDSVGNLVYGDVVYDTNNPLNRLTVSFTCSFGGKAILN